MTKLLVQKARRRLMAIAFTASIACASVPAAAGIISVNFGSTILINGVETSVDGNFLLDTSFPLVDGFNDDAVFGGSLTVGDLEIGPPVSESGFTSVFFQNTAPGVTGLSILGDDGDNFWGFDVFLSGETSAAGLYDFLLSGITETDILDVAGGATFEPFFLINFPTTSNILGEIESFSVTAVSVPEPGSMALVGVGALMWFGRRRLV